MSRICGRYPSKIRSLAQAQPSVIHSSVFTASRTVGPSPNVPRLCPIRSSYILTHQHPCELTMCNGPHLNSNVVCMAGNQCVGRWQSERFINCVHLARSRTRSEGSSGQVRICWFLDLDGLKLRLLPWQSKETCTVAGKTLTHTHTIERESHSSFISQLGVCFSCDISIGSFLLWFDALPFGHSDYSSRSPTYPAPSLVPHSDHSFFLMSPLKEPMGMDVPIVAITPTGTVG